MNVVCNRKIWAIFNRLRPCINQVRWTGEITSSKKNVTQLNVKDEEDALYRMIELETRGHDPAVLKSYEWFVHETAKHLDVKIGQSRVPKQLMERFSLLKSAHVHKKHFAQYEIRTYFRILELKYLTGSTAETFLEYIERNLPEGVAMKVTRHTLERLPEYVKSKN